MLGPGLFLFEGSDNVCTEICSGRLATCLAVPLAAGPVLTTIQDMVYNANGTPYNGFAVINWTPFVAGDTSQIATQSVTVNITAAI